MENILSENSVPVQENLKVTFIKAKFSRGKTKKGDPWTALDLVFKCEDYMGAKWLSHKLFQPRSDNFLEQQYFANTLAEVLDTLSQDNLWRSIPQSKTSWEKFYENYLNRIDNFRNKECYIKTVICKDWKDTSKYTACLANKNFISLTPNLKYSAIERNMVEEVQESEFGFEANADNEGFDY